VINAKDIALHADELKLQFDRDGFAFIQSLISRDYAQKIADTVFDVERQLLESPDETEHIFEKDDQDNIVAVRCLHNLIEQHPTFREMAGDQTVVDLAELALGYEPLYYRAISTLKHPSVGSAFPWHQDFAYWGKGRPDMIGIWIALHDATTENGCLEIIPKSHRWGVLPYEENNPGNPILSDEQEAGRIPAEVKAGDALLFHALLVHRSSPNQSEKERCAVIFEYTAREFNNGPHHFDRHCGWNPRTDEMVVL
jgi:ectoine hydroxylase-related dioxygenase (phytanoyl-CoA dioxygenase family)